MKMEKSSLTLTLEILNPPELLEDSSGPALKYFYGKA
jgi:hypothetical protein